MCTGFKGGLAVRFAGGSAGFTAGFAATYQNNLFIFHAEFLSLHKMRKIVLIQFSLVCYNKYYVQQVLQLVLRRALQECPQVLQLVLLPALQEYLLVLQLALQQPIKQYVYISCIIINNA